MEIFGHAVLYSLGLSAGDGVTPCDRGGRLSHVCLWPGPGPGLAEGGVWVLRLRHGLHALHAQEERLER